MSLPAIETAVFVSSWLTERHGKSLHPEAAYKIAGLVYDLCNKLQQHPEQDLVVFWEGLTEILDFCSKGRWVEHQDPLANWVPKSDALWEQLKLEGYLTDEPRTKKPLPFPQLKELVLQAAEEVLDDVGREELLRDSPFYTPEEWAARGEEWGLNSQLVLVHEGSWFSYLLNLEEQAYALYDAFAEKLNQILPDYHFELCTSWCSALYYDGVGAHNTNPKEEHD